MPVTNTENDSSNGLDIWSRKVLSGLKVSALVFVTASFVGIVLWLLLYSTQTGDIPFVISLRSSYQKQILRLQGLYQPSQKDYLTFNPVYNLQELSSPGSGLHKYVVWGTEAKFDIVSDTLTIKGLDNNLYFFAVRRNGLDIPPFSFPVYEVTGDSQQVSTKVIGFDNQNTTGNVKVEWIDKRGLPQIINDYKRDPSAPLTSGGDSTFILTIYR